MNFSISEVFLALGGFAGLFKITQEIYMLYMRSKRYNIENVNYNKWLIEQQMKVILDQTKCDKVLLLFVHNGGDEPQVGKPLYSSVANEVIRDGQPSRLHTWNAQLIDEFYTDLIVRVCRDKANPVNLETDKMPRSVLKDVYLSDQVHHTKVKHVYTYAPRPFKWFAKAKDQSIGKTWYLSAVWKSDNPVSASERDVIRFTSSNIARILEKQYRYD